MKKYLIILFILTGVIFQTQLFSYSGEKVGDIKCSEINSVTRYQNLSPSIITKIDLIGDKINNKYTDKDNTYKEKIYNLYIKVLNQYLEKTQYSEVQKEVLLRIGDYFVCKKEGLINKENLDVFNVKISDITDHGVKVTWKGNSKAETWVYVKKNDETGQRNKAFNNFFEYNNLAPNYAFTLFVQGVGSDVIKKIYFRTLDDNLDIENTNISKNKYLEDIDLPECDTNNSEVFFIENNDDWKHINDKNKRIFCVSPGDYTGLGRISLIRSGTENKRRIILLNNGNDLHPAKLQKSQLANFHLDFDADFWTVDRPATFDVNYDERLFHFSRNATNNILNRLYTENTTDPIWIREDAHNNTIQNSMFNGKSMAGYNSELGGILMEDWSTVTNIHGTKIINNEFINMNAVRLGDKEEQTHYFNNTIIDGNINEYNEDIRSDCGEATEFNPKGDCLYTEGFIVGIKGGSSDVNEPVIITNNVAYGMRNSRILGNEIGNAGDGITAYMGADHLFIHNNVFFDCIGGITIADSYGQPWGTLNADVQNNVLVDCGGYNDLDLVAPLRMYDAKDANIQNNLIVNPVGTYWAKIGDNISGSVFGNNDIVNVGSSILLSYGSGWKAKKNNFYDTSIEAGYTKDYVFIKNKFTNNPKTITISNVLK